MADRSKIKVVALAAGASDIFDSQPITAGKTLLVRKFGCSDDGSTNGKAATFRVQFGKPGGFTDVRVAAVNASTMELPVNREYMSDGTDFFRVTANNSSSASVRTVAWWIEAYDKD